SSDVPPYPLSLHDALPISTGTDTVTPLSGSALAHSLRSALDGPGRAAHDSGFALAADQEFQPVHGLTVEQHRDRVADQMRRIARSEEHTSELQSRFDLVCR